MTDACMCEWPRGCAGLGVLHCAGCGGDQCVCVCGGELSCDGCEECDIGDWSDEDWDELVPDAGEPLPPGPSRPIKLGSGDA